jgi:hypothetical protein
MSSRGLLKELADDAPTGPQDQGDGDQLPEQFRPGDGDSGEAHKGNHQIIEDAGAHLELEEGRIVGIEGGIQIRLDRR